MKEKFLTAIAYCTAVSVFSGGVYVVGSGVGSIVRDSVSGVLQTSQTQAVESNGDAADAAATGIKKVLKALIK